MSAAIDALFTGALYALGVFVAGLIGYAIAKTTYEMGQRGNVEGDGDHWRNTISTHEVIRRGFEGLGVILLLAFTAYAVVTDGNTTSQEATIRGMKAAGFVLIYLGGSYYSGIENGYMIAKRREMREKNSRELEK